MTVASVALMANWRLRMLREGENRGAYGFSFPQTRSDRMFAAAMEVVMPHLLKPDGFHAISSFFA